MRGASGGAAQESTLLELEDAVVDVEGVRHHDGVRDAHPPLSWNQVWIQSSLHEHDPWSSSHR